MGHGTPDRNSSQVYPDCAQKVTSLFSPSVKVAFGNVETSPPYLKDSLGGLIMSDIETLLVQPFMIVDGVHIHEDVKGALDDQSPSNMIYQQLVTVHGDAVGERLSKIKVVYKPGLGAYPGVFELFADQKEKNVRYPIGTILRLKQKTISLLQGI